MNLLQRFGHLPWIVAAPLFLLLVAYQALTFGLFAVIICRLRMHLGLKVTWLAPLVWVACELCVPYVFPWYLAITQAWVPTVIQIADITGPLGVSFLLVLSNGALFDVLHALGRAKPGRRLRAFLGTPLAAVAAIVLSLAYGTVRIHQVDAARQSAEKIRVGVAPSQEEQLFLPVCSPRSRIASSRYTASRTNNDSSILINNGLHWTALRVSNSVRFSPNTEQHGDRCNGPGVNSTL